MFEEHETVKYGGKFLRIRGISSNRNTYSLGSLLSSTQGYYHVRLSKKNKLTDEDRANLKRDWLDRLNVGDEVVMTNYFGNKILVITRIEDAFIEATYVHTDTEDAGVYAYRETERFCRLTGIAEFETCLVDKSPLHPEFLEARLQKVFAEAMFILGEKTKSDIGLDNLNKILAILKE